jgi:hypothetical protein
MSELVVFPFSGRLSKANALIRQREILPVHYFSICLMEAGLS